MTEMDYSKTVNLPKTKFSMKANLAQNEPKWIQFWAEKNVYQKMLDKNKDKKIFVLHDGPPYANGHIHIGHALNKILKDIIVKYKLLSGYYSPYIPGWDCHGLPIEHQLFKDLKISKEQISQLDFRKKAKEYAEKFVNIQKEEFIRLGVFGDWDKPYLTLNPNYEYTVIKTLQELVDNGYIYRQKKPVYWCIHCETSLSAATAEEEYADKTSDSIYVKFPVIQLSKNLGGKIDLGTGNTSSVENLFVLIWTTTPWTLPANLALAFKPDGKYVVVANYQSKTEYYILLEERLSHLETLLGKNLPIVKEFYGNEIALPEKELTTICQHPFINRVSICIPYENVSTEEGTGIIHIAPGHGEEDYQLGIKFGLEIYSPVNQKGQFSEHINIFGTDIYGKQVFKANPVIVEKLKEKDIILYNTQTTHSYPHCWRCKNPVIFRATEQWFLNINHNGLRDVMLENIKKVRWVPPYGENRISSMVSLRPDWCLSRQRYWGVPIPAVYCRICNEAIITEKILDLVAKIFRDEGSDSWFIREVQDFLPPGFKCPRCGNADVTAFRKESDILDVWYDSAVSYKFVNTNHKLPLPYMYLEGSDQHRGWFQVAMIVSSAINATPPYNTVLTHGFVVDGQGKKMSKSLGNIVAPQDVIKHYGAEILRLWTASADYSEDIRASIEIMNHLVDTYRKIRNTLRYILGNLSDFELSTNRHFILMNCRASILENFDLLDQYILSRLSNLVDEILTAYDEFKFYKVINLVNTFFVKTLSNFYFDILKDKLYTYKKDAVERRASQYVLYELLTTLVPLIAPILSFTAEEVWQEAKECRLVEQESVFLSELSAKSEQLKICKNDVLEKEFETIIELREVLNIELEKLRKEGIVGSSLETEVELKIFDVQYKTIIEKYKSMLKNIFIVSSVIVVDEGSIPGEQSIALQDISTSENKFKVSVKKFAGVKCPRCWVYYKSLESSGVCKKCDEALK